ncbi:MAG: P-loop NTPase [Lachnospiraceae bacterium]
MSENCNNNCSTCGKDCASRTAESLLAPANAYSKVKKVVAVVSGKGGVGKSLVTALLAVEAAKKGKKVGILDADITGPSVPKMFGIAGQVYGNEHGILPGYSRKEGIGMISTNLILEDAGEPVIWRGPVIAGVVKQFWTDVLWGEVDLLLVDMPPGTGDVPLTVFQSLPVDGIIVVTSPQDLVSMIVEKAVRMAEKMNIPVLGVVENLSYVACPDCGKKIKIFGESHTAEAAAAHSVPVLAELPIIPELAGLIDAGNVEDAPETALAAVDNVLEAIDAAKRREL